ncbi:hypothetical protein [Bradyrhizobium sp. BR 1432]
MIDLADVMLPGSAKSQATGRLTRMLVNVVVFEDEPQFPNH